VSRHLRLPYPPSVNTYWRHPTRGPLAGRHLISKQGRQYRAAVCEIAAGIFPLGGILAVQVDLTPPDRRKRDVDNPLKSLFDALTHAGVWSDDSQIKRLVVNMHDPKPGGGQVEVTIGPKEGGAPCNEP
jgi:crossover junction endodeoxyribonuclease RusA